MVGSIKERPDEANARRSRECRARKRAVGASEYDRNPERVKARIYAWRKANRGRDREQRKKYASTHRGLINALGAKCHAARLLRTPLWADLVAIKEIYEMAAEMTAKTGEAWHVDHEIPLQGKLVSGLHIAENLQLLLGEENIRKGNRFTIEEKHFG